MSAEHFCKTRGADPAALAARYDAKAAMWEAEDVADRHGRYVPGALATQAAIYRQMASEMRALAIPRGLEARSENT